MGESEWTNAITERLRLDVSIRHERGEPTKFSLNLSGLIDGEWVDLVRYDNAHDGRCHRHEMHPDEEDEIHPFLAVLPATFIDKAQTDLSKRAEEYLDEYERRLGNMNRRAQ